MHLVFTIGNQKKYEAKLNLSLNELLPNYMKSKNYQNKNTFKIPLNVIKITSMDFLIVNCILLFININYKIYLNFQKNQNSSSKKNPKRFYYEDDDDSDSYSSIDYSDEIEIDNGFDNMDNNKITNNNDITYGVINFL
jgi:hypothetical protein